MKPCTRCRRALDAFAFYQDPRAADGLTAECRECTLERQRAKRLASRLTTPVVEIVEHHCPTRRFLGRAQIVLSEGPMFFDDFVRAMRRPESEIVERAGELRAIAEAMRVGRSWVAYLKTESWERLHPFRASRGEVRRAA